MACAAAVLAAGPMGPSAAAVPVEGSTTLAQTLALAGEGPFRALAPAPGEPHVVREEGLGTARQARERRRRSLLYFSQLSDFQLADEESPARVEFADRLHPIFNAAWRPEEALGPHTVDAAIRQINSLADRSPVAAEGGRRARMALALVTGDNVDNMQENETRWEVTLLEGGGLTPNSGFEPAPVYTGVQDAHDLPLPDPYYYDPNAPSPSWAGWPRYPGLMDRAQQRFAARGLKVPSYVAFGNHDASVQGTQWANASFEALAVGGAKVYLNSLAGPTARDPARNFVDKAQYKRLHRTAASPDAHGFGLVDPAEDAASRGAAGYYAWNPRPGVRFIALDTVCEATSVAGSGPSEGNIDDPQFRWLSSQLRDATARDELVVLFSHHAIPSLTCNEPDERAAVCATTGPFGHDVNPGCDLDPRASTPLHLGADLEALVHRHPHVIAWVAGHTHNNLVEPFAGAVGNGFWSLRLSSEIDFPQQSRLIEIMDNRDGTLSLFGTIVDHAAPASVPASGTSAAAFGAAEMASISRVFAANDPQANPRASGSRADRNVELLVRDPRRAGFAPRCAEAARARLSLLRASRASLRRRLPARASRGSLDSFCLLDGGTLRAGFVRRRAVLLLSSSPSHALAGVRPGNEGVRVRRLAGARRVWRNGRTAWYAVAGRAATRVYALRGGRVVWVGLAERRRASGAAATRRLLRSFGAAL